MANQANGSTEPDIDGEVNRRQASLNAMAGGGVTFGLPDGAKAQVPAAQTAAAQTAAVDDLTLETVLGPAKGKDIQKALPHEHLFCDLLGPTDPNYMNVDWSTVSGACINGAAEWRGQGVNLVIDPTNLGIGRNVLLLRDVSRATGLNVVCSTGIFKNLIPPQYRDLSVDRMAERFVEELTKGCDGTMIRAGFIKIATTEEGPTETDTMIHHAAAIAGREVGCTIGLHSPLAGPTKSVVATLDSRKFPLDRLVWMHAQLSPIDDHKAMASRGATVQYDGISAHSDPFFTDDASMLDRIEAMAKAGFDKQVLVSVDAAVAMNPQKWQSGGHASYIQRNFAPQLVERLGEVLANQILRDNVIHAYRRADKLPSAALME